VLSSSYWGTDDLKFKPLLSWSFTRKTFPQRKEERERQGTRKNGKENKQHRVKREAGKNVLKRETKRGKKDGSEQRIN
jgi:hypothetical protein